MINIFRRLPGGGLTIPDYKEASRHHRIEKVTCPDMLYVPLYQYHGMFAEPIVCVGDRVLGNQLIARSDDVLTSDVHAPVSSTVLSLSKSYIVLQYDGLNEFVNNGPLLDWQHCTLEDFCYFLKQKGIVGLGGAMFPTHIKARQPIKTLLINAAECEPYITCDDRLIQEQTEGIIRGIEILAKVFQAEEIWLGIENNKPEALSAIQYVKKKQLPLLKVGVFPSLYPSGGSHQLAFLLTGKKIPHDQRLSEHGIQCFNIATCLAIHHAIDLGKPLTHRVVTLTGDVCYAKNIYVPIGSRLIDLLPYVMTTPERDQGVQFIRGGGMMGRPIDVMFAIDKGTNCVIVHKNQKSNTMMPCIRCGECSDICPMELQPMELYLSAKKNDSSRSAKLFLKDCIECGACDYVCPSHIPLTDYFINAKEYLRLEKEASTQAEKAKRRFEFRQERLVREKEEQFKKLSEKTHNRLLDAPEKSAAIQASLARAREKRKR
jgi:electron transport complex protein RnfC